MLHRWPLEDSKQLLLHSRFWDSHHPGYPFQSWHLLRNVAQPMWGEAGEELQQEKSWEESALAAWAQRLSQERGDLQEPQLPSILLDKVQESPGALNHGLEAIGGFHSKHWNAWYQNASGAKPGHQSHRPLSQHCF